MPDSRTAIVPTDHPSFLERRLCAILDHAYNVAESESRDPLTRLLSERAALKAELLAWIAELRLAAPR